jgi:ferric-dicitrate binding protein FerR (iron transport regulator)
MSERESTVLPKAEPDGGVEVDPVARLLRLAGARPPVPVERAGRVEAAVREAWQSAGAERRRRRRLAWSAGVAAAAALALALGVAWWPDPGATLMVAHVERITGAAQLQLEGARQPLVAGARLMPGALVVTDADGRAALRLAGGPSLRLDVESRLRLGGGGRLTLDRGALYVDSQGGPPITVQTPWGLVEERGTQFEVRVAGEAVRVRVREGGVVLGDGKGAWNAPAGEELVLGADGRLARGKVAFHGEPWSWVQQIAPPFDLEGRTLGQFLAWVGRETGRQVRWQEPAREATKSANVLHGTLEGMTPDESLAAVLPTCGLAHRLDGDTVVLFDHTTAAAR